MSDDHRDDAEQQYTPESICALVAAAENVRLIWHALGLEDRRRMPFIGLVVSDLVIAYEHLESISQDATIAAKDAEIADLNAELREHEIASLKQDAEIAALRAEIKLLRSGPCDSILNRLRALGWMVAVHNDYRQDGKNFTFWLVVNDDRAVKGEGLTDYDALQQIADRVLLDVSLTPPQEPQE